MVIGVQFLQIALFETVGASDAWATLFTAYSRQPVWPYAGFALVATAVALVGVWKRKPRPLSAAPGAAKASGHRR